MICINVIFKYIANLLDLLTTLMFFPKTYHESFQYFDIFITLLKTIKAYSSDYLAIQMKLNQSLDMVEESRISLVND